MAYTWENVEEELGIGMNQEAPLEGDAEYQKIEYTGDGLFDVTLRSDTSSLVYADFDFDEVVTLCKGYSLTPTDFLGEEEEDDEDE